MFRCCIGAEPRGGNSSGRANNGNGRANKKKKQSEVFFDMPKPEGQLSSVTDQANSADHKRRKESRDKEPTRPVPAPPRKPAASTGLDAPDNNGLSRGQNFMKVEKWLRESNKQVQVTIAPGNIANLEDHRPASGEVDAVPSERDRLPQTSTRR